MDAEAIIIGVGAVVIGLCLGSFLNVCILRLPYDQSLLHPPSTCPNCKQAIAWYDNLPLVSWLVLRARCRRCGARISWQYPVVEALVGVIFLAALLAWGPTPHALAGALFGTILLGIAITDAREKIIPNEFTVGGLVLGLLLSLAEGWQGFGQAVVGAAVGFGVLWVVAVVGSWAFGKEAMGGGDIKMMAMVGSFVGWKGVVLTVFTGALVGSVIFGPISLRRKDVLVPFGVFLALGAAVTFVYRDTIISWYLDFVGRM